MILLVSLHWGSLNKSLTKRLRTTDLYAISLHVFPSVVSCVCCLQGAERDVRGAGPAEGGGPASGLLRPLARRRIGDLHAGFGLLPQLAGRGRAYRQKLHDERGVRRRQNAQLDRPHPTSQIQGGRQEEKEEEKG